MVHKLIEPEPPPPSHLSDNTLAIDPEPPDQNKSADPDEQQWIDDVHHSAITTIRALHYHKAVINSNIKYTPFVHKLKIHNDFNKRLLQAKQRVSTKSKLPPPRVHTLHIPTPKIHLQHQKPSIIHDTTWKNYECGDWSRNDTGG